MTSRFFRRLFCQLLLLCALVPALAANDVELIGHEIEASDEGYKINPIYRFELNRSLEDALQSIDLAFTTKIELTRPRWWWTDEKPVSKKRTYVLSYNALTRRYKVATNNSVFQQTFDTIEDALAFIRRPGRWLIAQRGELKVGEVYTVTMRMYLDPNGLQKPLRISALNDPAWQFSSRENNFSYRAE